MCLIITALAAVAATLLWYYKPEQRRSANLGMLPLMYWGAALMWSVDGVFSLAAGEDFLDLSGNDALLGLLVVVCGLLAWGVSRVCMKRGKRVSTQNQ